MTDKGDRTTHMMANEPDPRRATTIKSFKQNVRGIAIILIVGGVLVVFAAGIAIGVQIGLAKGSQHASR